MVAKKIICPPFTAAAVLSLIAAAAAGCSNGTCGVMDNCSTDKDCGSGLHCYSCPAMGYSKRRCVRIKATNQFQILDNSLPFNKYAFLTTHNSYAREEEPSHTGVPRMTIASQDDTVTQQLNNGIRALMLDTYDFQEQIWLCHSFGGKCHDYTAFGPAIATLKEVDAFLRTNPTEIITLILEDYVQTQNGLSKVLKEAGLMKYMFPLSEMPRNGQDWPLVRDMVAKNHRLLVFTSVQSKEKSEGIAYRWNYMVENQYDEERKAPTICANRKESSALEDKSKSLILVNHFGPSFIDLACVHNSDELPKTIQACHDAAGARWANFLAVDYYKRSLGGGAFQAVDILSGELACGRKDVHQCRG